MTKPKHESIQEYTSNHIYCSASVYDNLSTAPNVKLVNPTLPPSYVTKPQ